MPDKTFRFKRPRKIGKRYQYQDLTFWAKNGFIYVEDRADNSFHTISRRDWLVRANAFVKEISKIGGITSNADNVFQKQTFLAEREALQGLVDAMIDVARRAKRQGDPTNPKVLSEVLRHTSKHAHVFMGGHGISSGIGVANGA
jgi:hypothetical protein